MKVSAGAPGGVDARHLISEAPARSVASPTADSMLAAGQVG
jgi:hypothetical protein